MISVGFDNVVIEIPNNIKHQIKHGRTFFSVVLHQELQTFILMRIRELEGSCLVIRDVNGTWKNIPFGEQAHELLPKGVRVVKY